MVDKMVGAPFPEWWARGKGMVGALPDPVALALDGWHVDDRCPGGVLPKLLKDSPGRGVDFLKIILGKAGGTGIGQGLDYFVVGVAL
jgi:hypothetical protein